MTMAAQSPKPGSLQEMQARAEDAVNGLAHHADHVAMPMGRRLALSRLVLAVWHDARRHHLQVFAGDLAYNAILALIPFILFVVLALRSVHADDLLNGAVAMFGVTLPATSARLLQDQIQAEVTSRVPDWWLLGVLLAAGSLWACSALFRAVTLALNVMYETHDDRSLWAGVAISVVFALGSAATWLILFILGETLTRAVADVAAGARGPIWAVVMLLGAFVFCASVYRLVPSDRRAFRAIVPGAACAAATWFMFSMVFDFVMNRFGQFLVEPLYGWFTGLFCLVLYLYWSAYIFLVGAEVNHALEANGRAGSHN
jgi:membrane protein